MRSLFVLAVLLGGLLVAEAQPVTVVTWNTKWLPGGRPDAGERAKAAQMAKAQAIVKALDPDILLLQEVADWRAAEELCSVVPGLKVQMVSAFETRPQQLVIASRFPADSAWYGGWKPVLGEDNPPRGYAFAALRLPGGKTLLTYSVHFKSNRGGIAANIAAREESAKQFAAHLAEMQTLYGARGATAALVGGDFNSDPGEPRFADDSTIPFLVREGLRWGFENVPRSQRVTIPASRDFPSGTFDHILYRGMRLDKIRVVDGSASSDHNPVVAIFTP